MGKPAPGFDLKVGSGVNMLSVKKNDDNFSRVFEIANQLLTCH